MPPIEYSFCFTTLAYRLFEITSTNTKMSKQYHHMSGSWITFEKPISDLTFTADDSMPLVPNLRTGGDYTLVISIPGGTDIGDGIGAVINIGR